MFGEDQGVVLKEETVLEKIDNETNRVVERIFIEDGVIVKHEVFDEDEPVTEEAKEVE